MAGLAVLGPVRVIGDHGAPVSVGSTRQVLLLAVLVTRLGRVVSADRLVDVLWGDEQPRHPMAALQSQVFRLRRQLPPAVWLENDGAGYRLRAERSCVDAARFEDLVAQADGRSTEPEVTVGLLDDALGLWRGRAYLEVADHEVIRAEAIRLEERRADAVELRASLQLELGRTHEAARSMEELLEEHPFRERPVSLRMRALAREGRHAEALRLYDEFRTTLVDELGLEPSPELRALQGEILRHDLPSAPKIGLPGNSLVGREVDLAEIASRLDDGRLVTLTGPGGVGKSRLALHAAARAAEHYLDGVYLCELSGIDTDDAVAPAVAAALHIEQSANQAAAARVVQFLRSRTALLLLDNCEHVLDGARALTAAVLAHTPDVDLLVTSRQRLGVDGEHVAAVAALQVPERDDVDAPAVVLFVDRATALRPGFALTGDNAPAVFELCRRLEGLPLAIELAAARTVSRTAAEILAEVADRIDRLGDPRRSNERHRSMEAVMGWSYDRLGSIEQHLFRRLAVFTGGFTVDAAAAVADAGPAETGEILTSLVEHSLLAARDDGHTTRFSMLEPIRQYAEAQLAAAGERRDAQARHAAWAAAWMQTADAGLRSVDEARWAKAVAVEFANLRTAYRWSLDNDVETAARVTGALYWYAYWYGASEAFVWAATVAARGDDISAAGLTGACATAALGACRRGDMTATRALAHRGLDGAGIGSSATARFTWQALSSAEVMTGNYERALACQQHALELARVAGDSAHQAREHAARALVLGYLDRFEEAHAELASATTLAAAAAVPTMRAFCDYVSGELQLDTAPNDALPALECARDIARSVGNQYLAAIAGLSALSCAARTGRPDDALAGYAELLDYFDRAGSRAQQWTTIRTLIETLAGLGRDEAAAILYGALTASPTALPLIGTDVARMRDASAMLQARLGSDRFKHAAARGAVLDDDEAIAYAVRATGTHGVTGSALTRDLVQSPTPRRA